ncbi:MAG: hypothetical protein PHR78_05695 [Eubacteriales bacterium]|nr:hypothetical protein [Eubacteriales bacterium]MDD4541630.1 hypothetical protein [Eubacteriales bacterium]
MKKISLIITFVLIFTLSTPRLAYANMAAPAIADIGSAITFEKNDTISVLSEVLDITVDGPEADIVATYKMKNTTGESIFTQSMFLSPNIDKSGVRVIVNDKDTAFEVESYVLYYDSKIKTDDWQYVLSDGEVASSNDEQTVDTINFQMDFAPYEQYDVVVSYRYSLGGYPDYDFNVKSGEIEYYLAPAAMWKDFGGITINLYLDKDMPVISSSNIEFKKIDTRTYQYVSDTLPEENLEIVVDENWFQNIFSTLRSPYLPMLLMMYLPFILIALIVVIFIVWRLRKRKV